MQSGVKVMPNIDIRKIFEEQASEVETKRALEILTQQEHETQHAAAVGLLADAVVFWVKRCEKLEKQRGELISALDTIRKMAEDERGYIPEDESEDFLADLWCKARNPVLKVRGEVE